MFKANKKVKFNKADHLISECNHTVDGNYIHQKHQSALEGKNVIHRVNQDGLRELLVPSIDPLKTVAIWPNSEFQRLNKHAQIISDEDIKRNIQKANKQKQKLEIESENRKNDLRKAQLQQQAKQGSKLFEKETDAADRSLYVLQRAFELRQEQEDEVKNANSIILAAKCLVVRKAQIIEKELMDKELREEDLRLDAMMEQERQKIIKLEENKMKTRQMKCLRHVKELSQQIRENQVKKDIDLENKLAESRKISKAMIKLQLDDLESKRKKKEEQEKTREQLRIANENIAHFKILQREEERIASLRVQMYMRKKAEREAAREMELAEIAAAKNLEIARLQASQKGAMDAQAAKDELNALRVQEEVEREWREKEKKAAEKRKKLIEDMQKGRTRQLEDLRKSQALEIQREREEFMQIAKVQKELHGVELEVKRQKKEAAMQHRKDLLRQVNENQLKRIEQLKEKYRDGDALLLEREVRDLNIHQILQRKVKKLKNDRVPDSLVKDIERQLKL